MGKHDGSPDSLDNIWGGEEQPKSGWRATWNKAYHDSLENPDPQMVEGSKWMSGIILGAICLALAIIIVCGGVALGVRFLQ